MIFDYLDDNHAITHAMFRRRQAGYKELGYSIEMPPDAAPVLFERETAGASNTLDGICAIATAPTFALQSPPP